MIYIIEIERVGSGGYITRLTDTRGNTMRFATRDAAGVMLAQLSHWNRANPFMRYEIIEAPEPPYVAERDPKHGMKE